MTKQKILIFLFIIGSVALGVWSMHLDAQLPPSTYPNMTTSVTVNNLGIVRIDSWNCFALESVPPVTKKCPARIELGMDVPGDILVCRSHQKGQTCKTLDSLFVEKR